MKKILTLTILVGALAVPASAATIATTVSQDTYIRNDGTPNSKNNGDGDNENLLGRNAGADDLRSLLGFDVSALTTELATTGGGDYSNLTINSATLTIFERRGRTFTATLNVSAYGFDFTAADATWNDPDGDGAVTGDALAGGTIGTLLGSSVVTWDNTADNDSTVFTLTAGSLATAIENAATTGELNLLLNSTDASSFFSMTSDSGTAARHAKLDIDYTVTAVPEPSSTALLGLGGLALILRRRK